MTFEEKLKSRIAEVPDFPKPGISFKDITPLLSDADLYSQLVEQLAQPFTSQKIDFVAGMESRGFLYGTGLANYLGAGFIPVRKKGKLPRPTLSASYELEYGSAELEVHKDDLTPGSRVLIHDDLLATGGTAAATHQLIEQAGSQVAGFSFIIELEFLAGRSKLQTKTIYSLVKY